MDDDLVRVASPVESGMQQGVNHLTKATFVVAAQGDHGHQLNRQPAGFPHILKASHGCFGPLLVDPHPNVENLLGIHGAARLVVLQVSV